MRAHFESVRRTLKRYGLRVLAFVARASKRQEEWGAKGDEEK